MKRVNWHIPEAAGVNVWPNVSSTRDELRFQVRYCLKLFIFPELPAQTRTQTKSSVLLMIVFGFG